MKMQIVKLSSMPNIHTNIYFLSILIISKLVNSDACPAKCYCGTDEEMTCEYLTEISFRQLYLPPRVTKLEISSSIVNRISEKLLVNLTDLREFSIIGSQLKVIDDNTFIAFNKLESLTLNNNQLNSISSKIFSGLVNLKFLELNKNNISELPIGVFNQLINIVEIRLMSNVLTEIPDDVFTMLPTLRKLFISSNKITIIGRKAFQNMTFNFLSLAKNHLTRIPPAAFKGFRISTSVMLLGNPFDCACNNSIDYAVNLAHLNGKMTAFCSTPYNVYSKHIMEAHNDLFCTQCDLNLCQNNARCIGDKNSFTCECQERYKGKNCEKNICIQGATTTVSTPRDVKIKTSSGSKMITFNDVKYVPLTEVKVRYVIGEKEKVLYAMCALEFLIIVFFVCFFAYKRYLEWKEEKRFNDEIGRDILNRVRYESNLKLTEALSNDPAPKHIKNMIFNGSVAV